MAYFVTDKKYVYGARTGDNRERLKKAKIGGKPSGAISVSGEYLIVSTVDGNVVLIDLAGFTPLAPIETPDKKPVKLKATVIDATVYLISGGLLYAVDIQ